MAEFSPELFCSGKTQSIMSSLDLPGIETLLIFRFLPASGRLPEAAQENALLTWGTRPRLQDALRNGFLGNMLDITIAELKDPASSLVEESRHNSTISLSKSALKSLEYNTLGFHVSAQLSSSARRDAGTLERDVWIVRRFRTEYDLELGKPLWERHIGKETGTNRTASIKRYSADRSRL